jgi:hypothetical protein
MKEKNHVKVLSPELTIPEIKKELRSRREGGKPSYNFFEAKRKTLKKKTK